jgi:predicted dinucleotide-binding enzyme
MKNPTLEYVILTVPFHAVAGTHEELAQKVNKRWAVAMTVTGRRFSAGKRCIKP